MTEIDFHGSSIIVEYAQKLHYPDFGLVPRTNEICQFVWCGSELEALCIDYTIPYHGFSKLNWNAEYLPHVKRLEEWGRRNAPPFIKFIGGRKIDTRPHELVTQWAKNDIGIFTSDMPESYYSHKANSLYEHARSIIEAIDRAERINAFTKRGL